MNGKSAGQTAYEGGLTVIAEDLDGEPWPWESLPQKLRESWEAAAAAVETEQIREIRADRNQLKKRMLDLAAAWKDEAADDLARVRPAPGGSTRAGVLNQCAGQICKGLDV